MTAICAARHPTRSGDWFYQIALTWIESGDRKTRGISVDLIDHFSITV
jgi:hypothetical protein